MLFYVTSNIDWTLLYCLFGMIIPFHKIFIFTWVFLRIYFNFRLNRMRAIQTIRVTIFFWGYSLSNWNVTPVPSCFFEIIKRTICFSQYQLIFWNIGWTYFHFCNIQNIKSNCWIIFLKLFAVIYFWWVIFLILVIFIINDLIFETPCGSFSISSKFKAVATAHWTDLASLFSGFFVAF